MRNSRGFSLVELMVVLVIMGVVTAQMFVVFSSQKRAYLSNDRALEIQEDARLITDLIAFDARQAGFMVPINARVGAFDGQMGGGIPDQPDRLCLSDSTIFNIPDYGQTSDDFDSNIRTWSGSNVQILLGNGVVVDTFDIDGDTVGDYFAGGGIIVATDTTAYCARIQTVVPPSTLIFADNIPGAIAATLVTATAVPAVVYEIDETNPAAPVLLRNGAPLANQVEDLQVEFWLDDQQGGNVGQIDAPTEWPVFALANMPLQLQTGELRRVRVSVVTRAPQAEQQDGQQFTFHMRPAAANRAEGTALDGFKRRRFTASVTPRNALVN